MTTRAKRVTPIAMGAALTAAALVAITGCGSSAKGDGASSSSSGSLASAVRAAPACLPATVKLDAALPGSSVDVSPAPGSVTANPRTQISFLGVPAARIHVISVTGARSGDHAGRLEPYSQGDGASFVPDKPFQAGEQVEVRATIGAAAGSASSSHQYSFRVDTPYSTTGVGEFPNPTAPPADYQSFDTLPGVQAPVLTVTVPDRDPGAGDVFTTNGPGPGRYGALIYTPQGRLVWFDQMAGGITADDLSVQSYRGQRDLTVWEGRVLSLGFGQGEDVVMNSSYQTVATVRGGNGLAADLHDFQIAAHSVAYITAYNPIHCDLSSAGGARDDVILDATVQEIDMRTGLVRWEWHSLDHVGVMESETSPPTGSAWDWFHLNSIDPEPDGNILISARNTWTAYQIQSGTGRILWRLGGLDSSFAMGPGTRTAWQHDARLLPDGEITMFDDGSDPTEPFEDDHSRAIRIALDLATHRARLVSALIHPSPPLLAASQGNMQTLADADTVVGYGGVPEISEYTPSGGLLFDAHLPYDLIFYRSFRHPWTGRPLTPPAVVANANNTNLETIVHMSWNGATGVASWRVLAGPRAASLAPQTTITSTGFESQTILPERFAYVAVAALDSGGHVLATSRSVKVGSFASAFPSPGRSG
jgi:hypothetical protein